MLFQEKMRASSSKRKVQYFSWLFVVYIYMTMLPSNSVYVTIFPPFRNYIWLFILIYSGINFSQYIFKSNIYSFIYICCFVISNFLCYTFTNNLLGEGIIYLVPFTSILLFCSLPNNIQASIYNKFVLFGAVYISLALGEYILHLVGINFYIASNIERGEGSQIVYNQGILNIYPVFEFPPRFQALFREAGFLGVCDGIILFNLHKYSRKVALPWILGGLFSLSLFFYVFLFLAFIYHVFYLHTIKLSKNISIVILLILGFVASLSILQDMIFARMGTMFDKGGDNRVTAAFESEFTKMFQSNIFLYGKGYVYFTKMDYVFGNGGVKAEIYKYGLIVVIVLLSGFFALLNRYDYSSREKLIIFFLYLLCFYSVDSKYTLHIYVLLLSLYNKSQLIGSQNK